MYIPTAQEFMRDIASQLALHGLKRKHLVERSGVSITTISLALNGHKDLRMETARKLSIATIQLAEESK